MEGSHSPFTKKKKKGGEDNTWECPYGQTI